MPLFKGILCGYIFNECIFEEITGKKIPRCINKRGIFTGLKVDYSSAAADSSGDKG